MINSKRPENEHEEDFHCVFWNDKPKNSSLLVKDKGVKLAGPARLVGMPVIIEVYSGEIDEEEKDDLIWESTEEGI